jgi:hypothetical protein
MSLINEALKKAQRQRGGDTPPAIGASPSPPPDAPQPAYSRSPRRPAAPTRTVALLAGGSVLLAALAVVAVVMLWPKEKSPAAPEKMAAVKPAPVAPPPAQSATAVNPAPPPTQSAASKPPAPANSPLPPLPALPSVAPAAVAATPAPVAPAPAPPAATIPVPINAAPPIAVAPPPPATVAPSSGLGSASPAPAPAPVTPIAVSPTPSPAPAAPAVVTPPAPPRPDPRLDALVAALRVTGVKAAAGDPEPRALMDNRVFKPGDLLDRASGLRLTKITPSTLTFTDANGFDYEKRL